MDRSIARSSIYNILSLCFTYPDEKIVTWIIHGEWIDTLKVALSLLAEEGFEKLLEPFKEFLSKAEEKEISLDLAREYTRLFINAFPHVVAPPYGSVYMEKSGRVFGETTSEILKFYYLNGFTLKEDVKDLPDHIAHELEFLSILTAKESEVSGSERVNLEEIQIDFFSRFLLPWVHHFCDRILNESHSLFYRSLARLTQEFINLEKNYLGIPENQNSIKMIESEIQGG